MLRRYFISSSISIIFSFYFFPTLRVGRVEVVRISVGDGGASPAETQQFATGAFLEFLVLPVHVHFLSVVDIVDVLAEDIAHRAFETAAGHHITRGKNSHVAIPAMAAVVDRIIVQSVGNLEQPLFIQEKRPKMVFEVKRRAAVLILLKFPPDTFQKIPILQRLDVSALLEAGRAVAPKGKNIDMMRYHEVDDVGDFPDVRSRYGSHHGATDTGSTDDGDFLDGRIE